LVFFIVCVASLAMDFVFALREERTAVGRMMVWFESKWRRGEGSGFVYDPA
jgi:hypothetical protein